MTFQGLSHKDKDLDKDFQASSQNFTIYGGVYGVTDN